MPKKNLAFFARRLVKSIVTLSLSQDNHETVVRYLINILRPQFSTNFKGKVTLFLEIAEFSYDTQCSIRRSLHAKNLLYPSRLFDKTTTFDRQADRHGQTHTGPQPVPRQRSVAQAKKSVARHELEYSLHTHEPRTRSRDPRSRLRSEMSSERRWRADDDDVTVTSLPVGGVAGTCSSNWSSHCSRLDLGLTCVSYQ